MNLGVFTAREKRVSGAYAPLTDAEVRKYTGLKGALGSARLQGVDAVKMIGSGLTLSLNRVSAGTAVMDWKQGKALVNDSGNPLAAAAVSLAATDPTFQIGGSVGLSIADVVFGSATVSVGRNPGAGLEAGQGSGDRLVEPAGFGGGGPDGGRSDLPDRRCGGLEYW